MVSAFKGLCGSNSHAPFAYITTIAVELFRQFRIKVNKYLEKTFYPLMLSFFLKVFHCFVLLPCSGSFWLERNRPDLRSASTGPNFLFYYL